MKPTLTSTGMEWHQCRVQLLPWSLLTPQAAPRERLWVGGTHWWSIPSLRSPLWIGFADYTVASRAWSIQHLRDGSESSNPVTDRLYPIRHPQGMPL